MGYIVGYRPTFGNHVLRLRISDINKLARGREILAATTQFVGDTGSRDFWIALSHIIYVHSEEMLM